MTVEEDDGAEGLIDSASCYLEREIRGVNLIGKEQRRGEKYGGQIPDEVKVKESEN